ncbi:MAG: tail fiber domain-containing protein [Kiritimatiellales bacterium]
MAFLRIDLPAFDEADDAKMRRQIKSYLAQLEKQLKYTLANLDGDNLSDTYADFVNSKVSSADYESRIQQTAEQIALKVTQTSYDGEKVYIGTSAPSLPIAGMKWIDTSVSPALLKYWDASLDTPAWVSAGADTVNAVSVLINVTDGLKVTQQLSGQSIYTYFKANATKFGLYLLSDDTPIAEAGYEDGVGYFAVTRIKDPQVDNDMHVEVFAESAGDDTIGLKFVHTIDGTGYERGRIGYVADTETTSYMFLKYWGAFVGLGYGGDGSGASLHGENDTNYAGVHMEGGAEGVDGAEFTAYHKDFPAMPVTITLVPATVVDDAVSDTGKILLDAYGDTSSKDGYVHVWAQQSTGRGTIETKGIIRPWATATDQLGYDGRRYICIYLTTSPNVSSDERLKRDIADIDGAKTLVLNLKPKQYRLKSEPDDAPLHMGFVHREVVDALKLAGMGAMAVAHTGDDGMGSLVYEEFIAAQTAMIQAQQQQIEALMARVEALEAR